MVKKIKLSKLKKVYDLLYTDKFSIIHKPKIKNPDGSVGVSNLPVYKYFDVECRISIDQEDDSKTDNEAYNPLQNIYKIFCTSDVEVLKGERIIAKKYDDNGNVMQTFVGIANKPVKYVTHQEFIIALEDGVDYGSY